MFSKIVRRTHMYLALFLAPWILMYALSTMAPTTCAAAATASQSLSGAAPLWMKRITYTPDNNNLRIERQESRMPTILEELHRRKGFEQNYLLADLWGITVDLVIAAMVFWVLSGLWMWWELKITRQWGGWFMLAGALLFALFIATI